jgi:uncharacterized protein CbrC (UPF0167 family)
LLEINFKYFSNPLKNAEFTDEKCQSCGSDEYCLEGVYFDKGDEVTSVCLDCLKKGIVTVDIPEFIQERIKSHLHETFPSKDEKEIELLYHSLLRELERTPPVPWIQYNDWPVCCGDFMQYIGEWKREDFNNAAEDRNGKNFIISILDDFTKSKIDDVDVFWNDIGEYTAVFVFKCLQCDKLTAIAQSY